MLPVNMCQGSCVLCGRGEEEAGAKVRLQFHWPIAACLCPYTVTSKHRIDTSALTHAGDKEARELEFRIIDYGHARLDKYKQLAKLPSAPGLELSYRKWVCLHCIHMSC